MTTSQEWAEKFFNYVAQERHEDPKKKPTDVKEPPGQGAEQNDNPDLPLEPEHDPDYDPDEDDEE